MKVLVVDVGGTHVKILATGQNESRKQARAVDDQRGMKGAYR